MSTVEAWDPLKVYRGALGGQEQYVKYQGGLWQARYYSVGENPALSDPSGGGAWFLAGRDTNGDGIVDGGTPVRPPVYVPVVPDEVTGIEASRKTDTAVALTWDRAYVNGLGDVTSYNIYQDGVKIGTSTTTSFLAKGLDADTAYKFSVEAINFMVGTTDTKNTSDTADDEIRTANRSDEVEVRTSTQEIQSDKFYSPYLDMTLPGDSFDKLAKDSGIKDFTLAFMQGLKSQIEGTQGLATDWLKMGEKPMLGWGGLSNTNIPQGVIIDQVREIEKLGGDVTISFGGYTGRDIAVLTRQYGDQLDGNRNDQMTAAEMAKAVKHLASQYQSVIDTYGVNRLDFDIENSTVSGNDIHKYKTVNDTEANHIRNLAIKQLQEANPDLFVSYTVATNPNGLNKTEANSGFVFQMFQQAKADGVKIDVVNIMAMDYFSDTVDIDMGETAINAAKAVYKQLTDPTSQGGVGMTGIKIGITPMIGLNDYWDVADNKKEVFTLQDAQEVVNFAKETPWVAGIGAWQITRDRAHGSDTTLEDDWVQGSGPRPSDHYNPDGSLKGTGTDGNKYPGPDPYHSDVEQDDWEFSGIFGKITKEATGGADIIAGGDEANNFNGLAGVDRIYGNGGNDTIDGGVGADRMYGGKGNDTFTVGNPNDRVYEAASSGYDRVNSSVSFSLAGQYIEFLDLTGNSNANGTGNSLDNTIYGNDGQNKLTGGAGNDILSGGLQNDQLFGGTGRDTLTGGSGTDKFVFDTAASSSNWDRVEDFVHDVDQIVLKDNYFAAVGAEVAANELRTVSSGHAAGDSNDFLIYNSTDGTLWYDANGSTGGDNAVQILDFTAKPAMLDSGDFLIMP